MTDLEPYGWNAVDCGSYTFPGAPVFVALDASISKQVATAYDRHGHGQNQENAETTDCNNLVVISDLDNISNSTNGTMADPLHLDQAGVGKHDPSEYSSSLPICSSCLKDVVWRTEAEDSVSLGPTLASTRLLEYDIQGPGES